MLVICLGNITHSEIVDTRPKLPIFSEEVDKILQITIALTDFLHVSQTQKEMLNASACISIEDDTEIAV